MSDSGFHVALVGASSLKGKELKEVIEGRRFPVRQLTLLEEEDVRGQLTEFQGEPTFIRSVDRESFPSVDLAFFAGSAVFTRNYWKLAVREGCCIIDLSDALEEEAPEARVAGPLATGGLPAGQGKLFVAAHPAALVISLILRRLSARVPLRRVVVNVFEPASERSSAGVEELHQQTVSLLSFQQWPKEVFDTQVAFNLLAACGEATRPPLVEVERRVLRHIGELQGRGQRLPSVRVIQSPTFHGHSFSFHLELEEPRAVGELESALTGEGFDLHLADQETPSAVGAATSDEVLVGDIRPDSASPGGYWLWAAADNLRMSALNAVRTAEELVRIP